MEGIVFGNISTETRETQLPTWTSFLGDMAKAIGTPVEFFYAPAYAGIIDAMRENRVQVAHLGPAAAVKAVDSANGEIAIRTSYKVGEDGYYALLLVHKDSPLTSLEDVLAHRGKLSLGTGDPNSTSGSLMPSYFAWAKHNVEVLAHFARVVRNNHEENMSAVASGELDVVTGNTVDLGRFARSKPEGHARLRVIWKSPIVLPDPIVWRKDLARSIKDKVAAFLLAYGRPTPTKSPADVQKEQAVLDRLQWWHFKPSDESQLTPIREVQAFSRNTH